MLKRTLILLTLVSAVGTGFPSAALASRTIAGRITVYSATSLSVIDKEVLTVAIDTRTLYTKLITQKPCQEDTRLSASALGVGRFVAVQMRRDNPNVAEWVQIATDMRLVALATTPSSAPFAALTASSNAPESNSKSSDRLTPRQVKEFIATARTPADHVKLQKHFLAVAAQYEADASEHAAEAQAYRQNPSFMDSKHPGKCWNGDALRSVRRTGSRSCQGSSSVGVYSRADGRREVATRRAICHVPVTVLFWTDRPALRMGYSRDSSPSLTRKGPLRGAVVETV